MTSMRDRFDDAWKLWQEHKMLCAGCRHGTACPEGVVLRDATLKTVRNAQYMEE